MKITLVVLRASLRRRGFQNLIEEVADVLPLGIRNWLHASEVAGVEIGVVAVGNDVGIALVVVIVVRVGLLLVVVLRLASAAGAVHAGVMLLDVVPVSAERTPVGATDVVDMPDVGSLGARGAIVGVVAIRTPTVEA